MTHKALAVGLDRRTMRQFLSRAGSRRLEVECVAQARQAVTMAMDHRYELVACAYPLPDMVLREFCRSLRDRHSTSRDAALLVLSLPDMQAEAQRALPSGRTLVRSRRGSEPALHEAIFHLLRVAPRRSINLPIVTSPADDPQSGNPRGRLVNISRSGMLISHPDPPPVGHRCNFSFDLSEGRHAVAGTGEVVRHARKNRDGVNGFAIRIVEFLQDAEVLLIDFLETQGAPGSN